MTPRPAVVVHYHEISLKRGNRPLFLRRLLQNLERATSDTGPVRAEHDAAPVEQGGRTGR